MFEYRGTAELLCVRQLFLIVRTDFVVYISKSTRNLNINGNCLLYLALPRLSSSYATPMCKHIYMYVQPIQSLFTLKAYQPYLTHGRI
jgi:hypothetical protein